MNKKIKFNFLLLITVAAFLFSACAAPDQSSDLRPGGFINLNSSAESADLSTLTSDFTVESSVQNNYRTYINHELVNECDFADDLITAAKNNENSSFRTVFFDENKDLSSYYDIISDKDGYHFVSYDKDEDKFIQSKQSFSCLKVFNVYGTPPEELKELGERNWYLNVVVLAKDKGVTYEDVDEYFGSLFSSVFDPSKEKSRDFVLIKMERVDISESEKEKIESLKSDSDKYIPFNYGMGYTQEVY